MKTLGNQDGAVFALVGLALFFLAAIIGFATDYGVVVYVQNQGQAAVDTAALAGASGIPDYAETGDSSVALARVAALDAANDVRGASAAVGATGSVDFLVYDQETDAFTCESGCDPEEVNAVRVTKTDYQAPFFFSWARGAFSGSQPSSIDVSVSAVGHIPCAGSLDADEGIGPIALRECYIDYPNDCSVPRVYQSGEDNSAFTTFNLTGANACKQLAAGNPPTNMQDTVRVGDSINLVGTGQVTSCLQEVDDRFDHCTEASCSSDPPDPTCVLPLPVIDCAGPESNGIVVGFAYACISDVQAPAGGEKSITAAIQCGEQAPSDPGGACFGTFAQRPVLIR